MSIDWVNLFWNPLSGAIITAAGGYAFKYSKYRVRRFQKKDSIEGVWHYYFYTNHNDDNTIKFTEAELSINKGVWKKYIAAEKRENGKSISYKGIVEKEGNCILVKMNSEEDDEFVFFRLYRTRSTDNAVIKGLQLSANIDGFPYCSAIIISRNRLEEQVVKRIFNEFYVHNAVEQMLTQISKTHKAAMYSIIEYSEKYLEQYCSLYIDTWMREPYGELFSKQEVIGNMMKNKNLLFLLIENSDERLVGFVGGRSMRLNCTFFTNKIDLDMSKAFYISELGVAENHKKKGWGSVLMSYIICTARESSFNEFVLRTHESGLNPAKKLYEKLGFATVKDRTGGLYGIDTHQKRIDDRPETDFRVYYHKKY